MTAPIELTRPLRLTTVLYSGTLQREAPLGSAETVLISVVEHGGAATTDELGGHLFGNGRAAVAWSVLKQLERRHLVSAVAEQDGDVWTLTESGIEALEAGIERREEFGVWSLSVVSDPLLGEVVLDLEAQTENLWDSIKGRGSHPRLDADDPAVWLANTGGAPVKVAASGERVWLPDGIELHMMRSSLQRHMLRWNPERRSIVIEVAGDPEVTISGPDVSAEEVLRASVTETGSHLTSDAQESVAPEDLTDRQLLEQTDDRDRSVTVSDFGTFTLRGTRISLVPVDDAAARRWAAARVALLADRTVTTSILDDLCERAWEGLGAPHTIERREAATIAVAREASDTRPAAFWHLMAAEDWGL